MLMACPTRTSDKQRTLSKIAKCFEKLSSVTLYLDIFDRIAELGLGIILQETTRSATYISKMLLIGSCKITYSGIELIRLCR